MLMLLEQRLLLVVLLLLLLVVMLVMEVFRGRRGVLSLNPTDRLEGFEGAVVGRAMMIRVVGLASTVLRLLRLEVRLPQIQPCDR